MPHTRAESMRLSIGDARHRARARTRPSLSSCGFTPVRSAHPVRAKDDGDGQVSWLAGQRRSAAFSGSKSQWQVADDSPRTVAGAAGVFPFPINPRCRGTSRCAAVSRILRLRSTASSRRSLEQPRQFALRRARLLRRQHVLRWLCHRAAAPRGRTGAGVGDARGATRARQEIDRRADRCFAWIA